MLSPTKGDSLGQLQLDKPVPRPSRTAEHQAQIHLHNRRREYLKRHPSYLESKEHELADPVLYERLVKRYQTADERAAEVKAKGYGRTLEADLLRGESRLAALPGSQRAQASIPSTDQGFEQDWARTAADKSDGMNLWHVFLTDRFVHGRDDDFDYTKVDMNDEYDNLIREDAEDAWFDDEEPSMVDDVDTAHSPRRGETGVQDF
ncbi:hypothetical protein NLU13_0111 [Sarocladium strictum]|uniref:CCD97-like C-terminal domain-containing protein n=1 Tax=Sarocladium strictum TaxID=5046 RepID=A0AA39GNH4_SARSR|nr:hypothetical protein NLU13_0111 [Sarocladium strictum]